MSTTQKHFAKFISATAILLTFMSSLQAQHIVRVVPRNNTVVVHRGVSYHYSNGCYYQQHRRGYLLVTPPVGLQVRVLPVGHTTIMIGGRAYFYFGGVYYVQLKPNCYEIAEAPKEACLPALPAGTETITIGGKRYYKINNVYYEKLISENGNASYLMVGEKIQ
jgi:hypothetical protein